MSAEIIVLSGDISFSGAAEATPALLAARPGTNVIINSTGGDVYAALHLANIIRTKKLSTICYGTAQSAALHVFAAGRRRLAAPDAVFMYHLSSIELRSCPAEEARVEAEELIRMDRLTTEQLAKITRRSADWWMRHAKPNYYFTGAEAARIGLATSTI